MVGVGVKEQKDFLPPKLADDFLPIWRADARQARDAWLGEIDESVFDRRYWRFRTPPKSPNMSER